MAVGVAVGLGTETVGTVIGSVVGTVTVGMDRELAGASPLSWVTPPFELRSRAYVVACPAWVLAAAKSSKHPTLLKTLQHEKPPPVSRPPRADPRRVHSGASPRGRAPRDFKAQVALYPYRRTSVNSSPFAGYLMCACTIDRRPVRMGSF